jgi:8-amino-7-oxononanoate synthase
VTPPTVTASPRTTPTALDWLAAAAADRADRGLVRTLRPRAATEDIVDLAGNDYLGLSRHPQVIEGGIAALRAWGAGATGSRLVTGTTALHAALEADLAAFTGAESALVFSSGYTANLAAVAALSGPGSLVVSDAGNHASLVDACRLSRARVVVTPHGDVAAVERVLAERSEDRAMVVTDSVFSVDGDMAPLPALYAVSSRQGAVLVVDEAHALGVVGPAGQGAVATAGLAGAPDVVTTVTLSKALGAQGGAVLGPPAVRAHLIDTGRSFVFDTGLAPAAVGAAQAALAVLRREPERAPAVRARADDLAGIARAAGLPASDAGGAVVSVVLGDPRRALAAAARCLECGVRVGCFRPPSVPVGTSRLRLTARADLTEADLRRAAIALQAAAAG